MRICGVELKNNEAIICLQAKSVGLFELPDCRARNLTVQDARSAEQLQAFQFAFAKLMVDYKIDKVVVRERAMKGKHAGGAAGFKLEAAIQLATGFDVEILSASTIKARIAANPLTIRFKETGLRPFQEVAFTTAYAGLLPDVEVKE